MKNTYRLLAGLLFVLLLSACSPQKSMIVLLPDQDGSVGAIEVKNEQGSVMVDEPGEQVVVAASRAPEKAAAPMSDEELETVFQEALAIEPLPPMSVLLYFQSDSTRLQTSSRDMIPDILAAIKERQSRDISVIGHTDRAGSKEYNFTLSTKRASHVRDLLVEAGVDVATIMVSSHGEGNPLVPTADNVAEPKNRRVEVVVR